MKGDIMLKDFLIGIGGNIVSTVITDKWKELEETQRALERAELARLTKEWNEEMENVALIMDENGNWNQHKIR